MLKQLQQNFYRDVLQLKTTNHYLDNDYFYGSDLIQIYHNQYFSILIGALSKSYACVKRLVGKDFFNAIAKEFIKTQPSRTGNIINYGSSFADFLAQHPSCQTMPYLADVAKFEHNYEQCYFSLKNDIFFQSDYPIIKIWQLNDDSEVLDLSIGGDCLKLYKQNNQVIVEKITQQEYTWKKKMKLYNETFAWIETYADDVFKLFVRLYVADAFFRSGWLKLNHWDTTLYLFENEYQVPIIPWELAAYLGTVAELVLPVLLVFGLLTRLIAIKLFVFNIIAVVSYPTIWQGGFYDHKLWGAMLLVTIIYGQGRVSIDNLITSIKK